MICLDAEAVVQDCEISNNRSTGVAVHTGGRPTITNCDIHHNQGNGLYTSDHAQGIVTGVPTCFVAKCRNVTRNTMISAAQQHGHH